MDYEARLEEGIAKAQEGQTEEARAIFAALAADPEAESVHIDAFFLQGRALFDLDRLEEARDSVEKALELVPGGRNGQLEAFLKMVKQRISLSKEEIAALDRSTELNSEAIELVQDGDYAAAEPLFRQAVEIFEKNEGALSNLTRCLVELRKLDDAMEFAKKRVDFFPENADGWVNLGYIHELKKDYAQARSCYDEALAIDPENEMAERGVDVVRSKMLAQFLPNVSYVEVSGSMESGFSDGDLAKIMSALNTQLDTGKDGEPAKENKTD